LTRRKLSHRAPPPNCWREYSPDVRKVSPRSLGAAGDGHEHCGNSIDPGRLPMVQIQKESGMGRRSGKKQHKPVSAAHRATTDHIPSRALTGQSRGQAEGATGPPKTKQPMMVPIHGTLSAEYDAIGIRDQPTRQRQDSEPPHETKQYEQQVHDFWLWSSPPGMTGTLAASLYIRPVLHRGSAPGLPVRHVWCLYVARQCLKIVTPQHACRSKCKS
jgi:hypothetical protein